MCMPSIIDNKEKTMLESLKNSLQQAESVDILTAFFYFSGFNALAEQLRDKKIRILVGNTIDPNAINDLSNSINNKQNPLLESYVDRQYYNKSNTQKKNQYIDSFIGLFNKSSLAENFDDIQSQKIFKMFMGKLNDGSLQIRLTAQPNHSKVYIFTNKQEYNFNGDQKGVVFMGSSNFTYNGLVRQGEMAERFADNSHYDEYKNRFEELWIDSEAINISIKDNNEEFVNKLKDKLWIYAKPTPFEIFIRILYEMYSSIDDTHIDTPYQISSGKFTNFKYQIDAIKLGIDCIGKNNGVIIADVVGLGKSIIASAIARNLDINKTIIIAPPHLCEQWEEYNQDFGLRGTKVVSSGKIEQLYDNHANDTNPILYIIDEAHRYRNELSIDYQYLHQLTRSNPNNKVILLTATPYNNRPQDLFALVKLFQTPSRSTISTVENLGESFRQLIARYNKLEKAGKKELTVIIKNELQQLSGQLRMLIDPIIIRRSRIDLNSIKEYADDLKSQSISFPQVVGPELLEYDLGDLNGIYLSTLEKLTSEFTASRYNSAAYLVDSTEFMDKYGELFDDTDILLFQRNLSQILKRQLVMRFESSKAAFKQSLDNWLLSYTNIKKWWDKGYIPIKKSGVLPDFDEQEVEEILREINDIEKDIDIDKIKKKAIPIPKNMFRPDFMVAIESDIRILTEIRDSWFATQGVGQDPKFELVKDKIKSLLKDNKNRKIVVFSSFADTAIYVKDRLSQDNIRTMLYTGKSHKSDRVIVRNNFDASVDSKIQSNDYDVIVATDSLSEGFNLNRAGIIFNYDIPYNPTRVVQRIGRINRINKKMFEHIFIYNLFPTDIGEKVTLLGGISKLKILLINNIVGSDTKTLTQDETLESYFRRQYNDADKSNNSKSWDTEFINLYNSIKHDTQLLDKVNRIPERARIIRKNAKDDLAIAFAKKGNNSIFAKALPKIEQAELLSAQQVLPLFSANFDEQSYEYDDSMDAKFSILRDEITKPYPKIKLDNRKGNAIKTLEKLITVAPYQKDYLDDLLTTIRQYDDLSDGELKYIANIKITKNNIKDTIQDLKIQIPENYINNIKQKVENIDQQSEIIMFIEDIRK